MRNQLTFEGYIEEIKLKNDKVLKFTLSHQARGRMRQITATLFYGVGTIEMFNKIEQLIGRLVLVEGEIYESNYKDKRTNQWVNTYCVQVNKLEERGI